MRLVIDAHLDIAWNALSLDRDQLLSIEELRASEQGMTGKGRARCTTSLPEMRRSGVGICLATVLSRALPKDLPETDPNMGTIAGRGHGEVILREDLDYSNQTICCAAAQAQMAYYRLLEQQGHMRMIGDRATLDEVWSLWQTSPESAPIGYILSMEGTDPIVDPSQAEWWFDQGLRTACLAHYGPSAYAMGTGGDGPLSAAAGSWSPNSTAWACCLIWCTPPTGRLPRRWKFTKGRSSSATAIAALWSRMTGRFPTSRSTR